MFASISVELGFLNKSGKNLGLWNKTITCIINLEDFGQ